MRRLTRADAQADPTGLLVHVERTFSQLLVE